MRQHVYAVKANPGKIRVVQGSADPDAETALNYTMSCKARQAVGDLSTGKGLSHYQNQLNLGKMA